MTGRDVPRRVISGGGGAAKHRDGREGSPALRHHTDEEEMTGGF